MPAPNQSTIAMRPVERFLAALAALDRGTIEEVRVAVVVAHPDDESIGIGGQLRRLGNVLIVVVTDGAPRDDDYARSQGFDGWRDYSTARGRELESALAAAGIAGEGIVRLDIADKSAAFNLAGIARALADSLLERRVEIVVTQPYEGGHPDHDATAFAVRGAAGLLVRAGEPAPSIVEMTSYYPVRTGLARQRFVPEPGCPETIVPLSADALGVKQSMFAAHRSQAAQLALFTATDERFRRAPEYDFTVPANRGLVQYHQTVPGLTSERWCRLALDALNELGLGG